MSESRRWLPTVLLALVVIVAWAWPALTAPTRLALGSPTGEAPGHLWSLWLVADQLWTCGPLVRCAPDMGWPQGLHTHLMDPTNLILFLPGYWLGGGGPTGAVLGWNLLHLGALALGFGGAAALGRSLGLERPWVLALVAVVFGASSYLLGHPFLGRTEILPAVLWPWHLVLLLRYLRSGSWRWGVGAGVVLGLAAAGGTYLAVFLGLLEVPLGLWLLSRWSQVQEVRWKQLALVAAVAGLVLSPAALALVLYPPEDLPSLLVSEARPTREAVAALGTLGHLTPLSSHLDQPPYPGMVALSLGIWGAVLNPRAALPWLLLALWGVVLGLGRVLPLGQAELRLPAAWLVTVLPPLGNIRHWSRLAPLISLPLALAAGWGARALVEDWPRRRSAFLLVPVALMALADQASWPRLWTFQRPSFEVRAPAPLLDHLERLPQGAVIQLPLERTAQSSDELMSGFYALWQLQHHRPVTAPPAFGTDELLARSMLLNLAAVGQAEAGGPGRPQRPRQTISEAQRRCVLADVASLHQHGVAGVVVHRDRPQGEVMARLVTDLLGPAWLSDRHLATWSLERVPAPQGPVGPCELPVLLSTPRPGRGPQAPPSPEKAAR